MIYAEASVAADYNRQLSALVSCLVDYGTLVARLRELREEIAARLADEDRDRQMIAEHALDVLTDLLEGGSDGTDL